MTYTNIIENPLGKVGSVLRDLADRPGYSKASDLARTDHRMGSREINRILRELEALSLVEELKQWDSDWNNWAATPLGKSIAAAAEARVEIARAREYESEIQNLFRHARRLCKMSLTGSVPANQIFAQTRVLNETLEKLTRVDLKRVRQPEGIKQHAKRLFSFRTIAPEITNLIIHARKDSYSRLVAVDGAKNVFGILKHCQTLGIQLNLPKELADELFMEKLSRE